MIPQLYKLVSKFCYKPLQNVYFKVFKNVYVYFLGLSVASKTFNSTTVTYSCVTESCFKGKGNSFTVHSTLLAS